MANQVTTWPLAAVATLLVSQASASAEGVQNLRKADYGGVTIEHAELALAPQGLRDTAYVTIYNGTLGDVAISDVKVGGYSTAILVSRAAGLTGFKETPLKDAFIVIPRKAELDMGRDTVFISLDRVSRLPRSVTMTIEFDDGTSRTVPLAILDGDRAETSHHHAAPNFE
jgi:hypothetical protein